MKIVLCENRDFTHEGEKYTVSSREYMTGQLVTLLGPGIEISVVDSTRGAGMINLGKILKGLGQQLLREAFIQEGAIDLGKGKRL